jgi:hypothetical protein
LVVVVFALELVGVVLVGLLYDLFEREPDGRGVEGFLGRILVAEDGEDDVVGRVVVFVPQTLEHAELPEALQHAVDLATLRQIGGPRHDPQVQRAPRKELRRCSAGRHDSVELGCWSDASSLRCSESLGRSGSPNLPKHRIAGTHVALGKTRPCSWDADLHITIKRANGIYRWMHLWLWH